MALLAAAGYFLHDGISNIQDEFKLIKTGKTVQGYIIETWEDAIDTDRGSVQWIHGATYIYKTGNGLSYEGNTEGDGRLSR